MESNDYKVNVRWVTSLRKAGVSDMWPAGRIRPAARARVDRRAVAELRANCSVPLRAASDRSLRPLA